MYHKEIAQRKKIFCGLTDGLVVKLPQNPVLSEQINWKYTTYTKVVVNHCVFWRLTEKIEICIMYE